MSVLCALALVSVAFAHRPIAPASATSSPQIAAYLAQGGSLVDLCLSGDMGKGGTPDQHCPACTLAKTMALAPANLVALRTAAWSDAPVSMAAAPVLTGHSPRAPPARGPPARQLI